MKVPLVQDEHAAAAAAGKQARSECMNINEWWALKDGPAPASWSSLRRLRAVGDGVWQQSTSRNFVAGVVAVGLKTSLNESSLEEIWSQLRALFSHRSQFESLTRFLMRISWTVSWHLVYLFTESVASIRASAHIFHHRWLAYQCV